MGSKDFIHSPGKGRGRMWRDIPALRDGDFDLSLNYTGIKKGEAAVVRPLDCWGCCNTRLQFVSMFFSACDCR